MDLNDEALLTIFEEKLSQQWDQATHLKFIDPSTETAMALRDDRVLNYVWLNKESLKNRPEQPEELCGVPLSYLDRAYANARRYPDTQTFIWMDYALFDDSTKFFIDTHAYLNAPPNAKFMDLRGITAYANCVYYQPDSKAHIHCKVDLSRIIVLEHVKRTMNFGAAFYADFDVDDVQLSCTGTWDLMDKNGIVFGKLPRPESISSDFRNNLHPGYIAVNDKGGEYLTQRLLPYLLERTLTNKSAVFGIFRSLGIEFGNGDWDDGAGLADTLNSLIISIPMHPPGYVMPEMQNYNFDKLCGSASLWAAPVKDL